MISMDKKYRTRDGRDVRLLCVDGPEEYPVVGIVEGGPSPGSWTSEGFWCSRGNEDGCDLIEHHEPDIRTIWVNVYKDGTCSYDLESEAKGNALARDAIVIAQPVTFEVKREIPHIVKNA